MISKIMQIDVLFAFLTSVFFLTLSPGPDIIYVFYKSSTAGFKEAAKLSIGLTSGLLIHTLFVVLGISALIKSNQDYYDIIKYFGFIYFSYLALSQFLNKNKSDNKRNEGKNSFVTGLLMNLLNPKVSIFFIAFLPAFIFHNDLAVNLQFIILGFIFWLIATLIFLTISYFSNFLKPKFENFMKSKESKFIQGIIFQLIAIYILLS